MVRYNATWLLLSLFSFNLYCGEVVVPSDLDYFEREGDGYNYIFSESRAGYLDSIVDTNQQVQKIFEKSFNWQLDESTSMVLASEKNQLANAFATVTPNNLITFYAPGSSMVDYFATESWIKTLLFHEGSHLYQLNAKSSFPALVKKIFGNPIAVMPIPFFWIFPNPNVVLPNFLLEGNSVLNESRFGNGGRLYSGEVRALVYALLRGNRVNPNRLTNQHLDFPGGSEKYLVGGYFMLYLSQKYGVDRVNSFFKEQGSHWFWPLILDSTFQSHFGKGLYQLLYEFEIIFGNHARNQQGLAETSLVNSLYQSPINSNETEIFFLTSSDGKSYPQLNVLNKQTGRFIQKTIDLPIGKVFKIGENYYSQSSGMVDNKSMLYTLWGDGYTHLEKYNSKIVLDLLGDDLLYFDAKKSFDMPKLFFNDKYLTEVNSTALFDKDKAVYYFRQSNGKRTLYKNSQRLISFDGHYGKIVDIDHATGAIYFIASTQYGSTLFSFESGTIYRLSDSDTIIEGRKISGDKFLISEVTTTGYQYKITVIKKSQAIPFKYSYFFEKSPEYTALANIKIDKVKQTMSATSNSYNSLTSLRYSSLEFEYRIPTSTIDSRERLSATFVDPLAYNQLNLIAEQDHDNHQDLFAFQYNNSKYLLNWFYLFAYENREQYSEGRYLYLARTEILNELGITYNLAHWNRWDLDFKGLGFIESADLDNQGGYGKLAISRTVEQPYALFPYRYFLLQSEMKFETIGESYSAASKWSHDVGHENIFSFAAIYSQTTTGELEVGNTLGTLDKDFIPAPINIYSYGGNTTGGSKAGIAYAKVLNWPIYFSSFPISLRRFAPRIMFNRYEYTAGFTRSGFETIYSITPELLIAHKFPVEVTFDIVKRSGDLTSSAISLNLRVAN